ncbi:NAD-dependent epimerase/dehydratase family protein [Desulfopila sp. IMCC35006]|uniref:NAD-dependent epimerase/dehydratase family protein n=1 Tax=Desulfopila sp. IMCC35006 TaxID=2569542 RepID=UPI0010AD0239|nr:NAD-dependent epimerase/dehydratase family protein [Desulfopila sp. IMCC35006]TKB26464.1 NAD-dependent epimerase/dehydratase family protein [Desulfopila sp. IMCC35006]
MTAQGILLLGGAGFVGRALTARLKALNKEYYILGRGVRGGLAKPSEEHHIASLDNTQVLKVLLPRCRVVVHLASDTTPGVSALQPAFEAMSNLLPSLRFLEILQGYSHISLVYVSTGGAIYGDSHAEKISEDTHSAPLSYYGAGKAAFEKFIHAYTKQTGNGAIILRPSNFYGPGQPYRPGFGIIPTIFHHLSARKTMEVWGDGETVRDYLYLEDFLDCCIRVIDQFNVNDRAAIYNVGSGEGRSLNTLFSMIESISGNRVERKYRPTRAVDVNRVVLDSSRIQNDYSWKPKTDLYSGLSKAWTWYQTCITAK